MLNHLPLDEKWNVYTHGFGALLSIVGVGLLIYSTELNPLEFGAFLIYGASMVFLFSASAIYHSVPPERQAFWQKIDHIGIYFLIAGTYTPVTLTILKDSSGLYLLAGVWLLLFWAWCIKSFLLGSSEIFLSSFIWLWVGWSFSILKMW